MNYLDNIRKEIKNTLVEFNLPDKEIDKIEFKLHPYFNSKNEQLITFKYNNINYRIYLNPYKDIIKDYEIIE